MLRDLGVHLDSHMTFGEHADQVAQQMSGILCYISRIRHFLTEEATRLLVEALVLTRLDYCPVVWGNINNTSVTKL